MPQTPQQNAVCDHVVASPNNLAVVARAGTGKSSTIENAVRPLSRRERTIVVAYGKDIADAMRPRVPRWVDVKTLHALGYRAIQRARGTTLAPDKSRGRNIAARLVPQSSSYTHRFVVTAVARVGSIAMNHLALTPEAIEPLLDEYGIVTDPAIPRKQYAVWAAELLAESRKPAATISFDEMVFLPAVEGVFCGPYDYAFLDEMQDSNPCQKVLFQSTLVDDGKAVVVYDDRQCIYRFRGASEEAVEGFVQDLKADILPLTVCFRCPREVVRLARCLVPDFEACDAAPEGQVSWVTEEDLLAGIRPGHVVLARSNYAVSRMCLKLAKKGVPARVVGKDHAEQFRAILDIGPGGTTPDFLGWLREYQESECARLAAADEEERAEALVEVLDTLREISEGSRYVHEIARRVASVFVDEEEAANGACVTLMTSHKAKGLQWPDVWLLESSFQLRTSEDENLYYVAVTRTMWTPEYAGHLRLVQTPRRDGKWPTSIARRLLDEAQ